MPDPHGMGRGCQRASAWPSPEQDMALGSTEWGQIYWIPSCRAEACCMHAVSSPGVAGPGQGLLGHTTIQLFNGSESRARWLQGHAADCSRGCRGAALPCHRRQHPWPWAYSAADPL